MATKLVWGLAGSLAAVGAAGAADDDVKAAGSAPPAGVTVNVKKGDQWTYEVRDGLTGEHKATLNYVVSDVLPDEIDTRTRSKTGTAETTNLVIFDGLWRRKDDGAFTYKEKQDDWGIHENLAVGETWSYTYEVSRASPPSDFKFTGAGNVLRWARVTLPSGQAYDAFEIEFKEAMVNVVNERKFEFFVTEWYAPSVNRYVKRLYETRRNAKLLDSALEYLVDYTPES